MKREFVYILIATLFSLCACVSQPDSDASESCNIKGFAQKGQLVKGSPVTVFTLGRNMTATGESYPANIIDDLGSFDITFTTRSPYLELRAEGYFFNEITGEVSASPIYLEAIAPSRSSEININLLTTIIKPRVKRLVASGVGYAAAVAQAQRELFDCFGAQADFVGDFADADITGRGDIDAILLAYACIVQQNRSISDMVALIQATASEFEREGRLSQSTIAKIEAGRADVDPFDVIYNIANYYADKSVEGLSVPPFYKYLDDRYAADFVLRSSASDNVPTSPGSTPHYEAISASFDILSAVEFEVECAEGFVSIDKSHIMGDMYTVDVHIAENDSPEARTTEIIFKDLSGRELARKRFVQEANLQIIRLKIGAGSRTSITVSGFGYPHFNIGDTIGVNGVAYDLDVQSEHEAIVKVPRAESFFMSFPLGSVSKAGHIAKVSVDIPETIDAASVIPYYAALAEYKGLEVANPATVELVPVVAMLGICVRDYGQISHLVIRGNGADDYLCGRFSYVPISDDIHFYPDLDTTMTKGSGKEMTLKYQESSDSFVALLPPIELASGITIELFDAEGKEGDKVELNQSITLKAGTIVRLTIKKK